VKGSTDVSELEAFNFEDEDETGGLIADGSAGESDTGSYADSDGDEPEQEGEE
jgi:hypothetical protein